MRVLVHDFSGHPFQVELSRELSRRGHDVTHSFCAAYVSGKGHLAAEDGESIRFDPIGVGGDPVDKESNLRRLVQELVHGFQLVAQVRRLRPEVVMASNTPIPSLVIVAAFLWLRRIPWVLWHQDVHAVALQSFAGDKLSRAYVLVARAIGIAERWCSRRAAAIVVITESFVDVHRRWGTAQKTTVIPNWAPIDEILPTDRRNPWSRDHDLDDVHTLLYSGTLGLKHDPALLVRLARAVADAGTPVRLVVVNEGPAEAVVRAEAERLGVPLTQLPFQPYERLSEVLGSGDVLVVLLERSAGAFSVPSKTLSYLCAGRPIVGLMPAENLAARVIEEAQGCVLAPEDASLSEAASWIRMLLADDEQRQRLGKEARALAEREFALEACADRFEAILGAARRRTTLTLVGPS